MSFTTDALSATVSLGVIVRLGLWLAPPVCSDTPVVVGVAQAASCCSGCAEPKRPDEGASVGVSLLSVGIVDDIGIAVAEVVAIHEHHRCLASQRIQN